MTIIAIWLGWQAGIVRERQALIVEGKERGLWQVRFNTSRWSIRSLMGDQAVEFVDVNKDIPPQDLARLDEAFPEAQGRILGVFSKTHCESWIVHPLDGLLEFYRQDQGNEAEL